MLRPLFSYLNVVSFAQSTQVPVLLAQLHDFQVEVFVVLAELVDLTPQPRPVLVSRCLQGRHLVLDVLASGQQESDPGDKDSRHRGDDVDQCLDRKSTRLNSSHVKISYAV